ncbi:methylmalonyl-CoA mutase [Desulfosarcina ovata subsp. sediminis]|uniref:Methylmalonyl-CoA mutase n=1 Tax=Desulfosarcina ovata subsp. sediminis TaxID=885957 RepID=A0A5K7ZY51_9BACT|nr:cobalamin B12-binding domain-containing protein [Desulfosarcina ovata]BBO85074.1 methylmalonyl-CoA mutase [Desulfosarcina ovata subsp. sediminis]
MDRKRLRILVAKPGLDGHDRGAKIISLALRDAGMEVIYSGLHQSIEQIVSTAVQESVDIIGLSIMTGAHLSISQNLVNKLSDEGIDDMRIVVGGVIPKNDIQKLKAMGVAEVFPNGTKFDQIIDGLNALV